MHVMFVTDPRLVVSSRGGTTAPTGMFIHAALKALQLQFPSSCIVVTHSGIKSSLYYTGGAAVITCKAESTSEHQRTDQHQLVNWTAIIWHPQCEHCAPSTVTTTSSCFICVSDSERNGIRYQGFDQPKQKILGFSRGLQWGSEHQGPSGQVVYSAGATLKPHKPEHQQSRAL